MREGVYELGGCSDRLPPPHEPPQLKSIGKGLTLEVVVRRHQGLIARLGHRIDAVSNLAQFGRTVEVVVTVVAARPRTELLLAVAAMQAHVTHRTHGCV